MPIEQNSVVTLHYILKNNDGRIIDKSHDGSFLYLHGAMNIVPGLENALAGKSAGDEFSVTVSPEEGYGEKDRLVKRSVKKYSAFMNQISVKIDKEVDVFAECFSEGFRAYEKLAMIYFELFKDYQALQNTYDSISSLPPAMDEALEGLKLMRNAISGFPRNFPHLERARLNFIDTANSIMNEIKLAKKMSEDFARNLADKLN